MSATLEFTVLGIPVPQGSKRSLGRFGMIDANQSVLKPWRDSVTYAAHEAHAGMARFDGPVHVGIMFSFTRPKSVSVRARPEHTVKPDLDKCCRGVLDALTAAGVWRDDSQVMSLVASKRYADTPSAWVIVHDRTPE